MALSFFNDNSKNNSPINTKFLLYIDLSERKTPIDFQRSRSHLYTAHANRQISRLRHYRLMDCYRTERHNFTACMVGPRSRNQLCHLPRVTLACPRSHLKICGWHFLICFNVYQSADANKNTRMTITEKNLNCQNISKCHLSTKISDFVYKGVKQ